MHTKQLLVVLSIKAVLVGCASGPGDSILPTPDRSMSAVYHDAVGASSHNQLYDERSVLRRSLTEDDVDLAAYTRTEDDALANAFPLLPNPELRTYVAPHLSTRDGVPIPGYVTRWPMYTRQHYALPGEALLNYRNTGRGE